VEDGDSGLKIIYSLEVTGWQTQNHQELKKGYTEDKRQNKKL
jgi:hypothetical protein